MRYRLSTYPPAFPEWQYGYVESAHRVSRWPIHAEYTSYAGHIWIIQQGFYGYRPDGWTLEQSQQSVDRQCVEDIFACYVMIRSTNTSEEKDLWKSSLLLMLMSDQL